MRGDNDNRAYAHSLEPYIWKSHNTEKIHRITSGLEKLSNPFHHSLHTQNYRPKENFLWKENPQYRNYKDEYITEKFINVSFNQQIYSPCSKTSEEVQVCCLNLCSITRLACNPRILFTCSLLKPNNDKKRENFIHFLVPRKSNPHLKTNVSDLYLPGQLTEICY